LGRWLLVACFSSVKNHNVSGPHLFPSFTTYQKNPFTTPRTVLQRSKKSLCNRSQFRTMLLPHRLIKIRPSHLRPSALNFSQFVGFLDSPNLSKIEKVAETCEFDGKEPLFVERTIANSNRVLGWTWWIVYRKKWGTIRARQLLRNREIVVGWMGGVVGAKGQLTQGPNVPNPRTNTNAQKKI